MDGPLPPAVHPPDDHRQQPPLQAQGQPEPDHRRATHHLETGEMIASFHGDAGFPCCVVTPEGRTIVTGDRLGRVHFLALEEPAPAGSNPHLSAAARSGV